MSLADVVIILVSIGGKSELQVCHLHSPYSNDQISHLLFPVIAADGLAKRSIFRLPDPFVVITVDLEQTHTTSVIKKTLNPYWNEHFDVSVVLF
jgi:Ca2+-dependent lipid-binding protein